MLFKNEMNNELFKNYYLILVLMLLNKIICISFQFWTRSIHGFSAYCLLQAIVPSPSDVRPTTFKTVHTMMIRQLLTCWSAMCTIFTTFVATRFNSIRCVYCMKTVFVCMLWIVDSTVNDVMKFSHRVPTHKLSTSKTCF